MSRYRLENDYDGGMAFIDSEKIINTIPMDYANVITRLNKYDEAIKKIAQKTKSRNATSNFHIQKIIKELLK